MRDWHASPPPSLQPRRLNHPIQLLARRQGLQFTVGRGGHTHVPLKVAVKISNIGVTHFFGNGLDAQVSSVGRFGRLWMAGTEADILAARDAAVLALNRIEGVG